MEVLLETNNTKEIINLIESRLEDEFFSLIVMYDCPVPEMDYWIKSEIIDRLSDSSVSFNSDRFSQSGGNIINDDIRIFIKPIDDSDENFNYLVVENEPYVDQNPELKDYEESFLDYSEAFKLFEEWGYNYINNDQNIINFWKESLRF